jgi:hypothetical protein
VLIASVAGFGFDTGMIALLVSAALILLRAADEARAIQRMPWGVMLMVTGVTVLIALMQSAQGLELITGADRRVSRPRRPSLTASSRSGSGVVSVYSSTSGVVLPAFLPMAPDTRAAARRPRPAWHRWSINVGASSWTCRRSRPSGRCSLPARRRAPTRGRSSTGCSPGGSTMAVVGAALCWAAFGLNARQQGARAIYCASTIVCLSVRPRQTTAPSASLNTGRTRG